MNTEAFSAAQWGALSGALVGLLAIVVAVVKARAWLRAEIAGYLDSRSGRDQVEEIAGRAIRLDLTQLFAKLDRLADEIDRLVKSHDRQAESLASMQSDLITLKAQRPQRSTQ